MVENRVKEERQNTAVTKISVTRTQYNSLHSDSSSSDKVTIVFRTYSTYYFLVLVFYHFSFLF